MKRKHESREERYRRKIKKLEKKLKANKNRESRSPSSPPVAPLPEYDSFNEENDVDEIPDMTGTELTGAKCVENTKDDPPIEILDDSIIKALGQTVSTEREYGPEIHMELVKRFEGIITQGLQQDIKDELVKKYLVPTNIKLLDAPKLNKELEGLLNDAVRARDKRVEERQQQTGVAIAALLSTTDKLIKVDVDKIKLISTISDVTRLLMDLHHEDTVIRKKLIIPNLDRNIGKIVENQRRDEFLCGEKFQENVKAATAIKKSAGTILKQNNSIRRNTSFNRPSQSQNYPKKQGNFKGPPRARMTQFKQGGGRYHQQTQHYKPRPPQHPPAKPSVRQT